LQTFAITTKINAGQLSQRKQLICGQLFEMSVRKEVIQEEEMGKSESFSTALIRVCSLIGYRQI